MQIETGARRFLVLVVDDDRAVSRLIKYNLENKDIQVVEAATGLDGIQILSQMRVDLVLLDLKLPDFNGWGILSLIRLTESLNRLPVIMTSIEPPRTALIAQLQPDEYVQKPFDVRDLLVRVNRIINSGNARRRTTNRIT